MHKSIILTPTQIKAYKAGASMFLFPADNQDDLEMGIKVLGQKAVNEFILRYSPIQACDKDIFVQEEFAVHDDGSVVYNDYENFHDDVILYEAQYFKASQMTKEQSRYSFSECIDVRVIRFKDISADNKIIKYIGVTEEDAILYNGWKPTYDDTDSGGRLAWDIAFEEFYSQQMKEQNINRTYEDNDYIFLIEFA